MRALQSVLARHGKDYAAVVPRSLQWKLFENRRNRRALSLPLGLVEPIEQTRRCIGRDLRGDLDRSGDSAVGPASVDAGKYLLVIFAGRLALTYRRLQFSNASWVLLAGFVILHAIGAHYTYEKMPLGIWAKDFFHLSRNHYDRFAHGAFGFLLAYPIRELILRFSGIRPRCMEFCITGSDHPRCQRLL